MEHSKIKHLAMAAIAFISIAAHSKETKKEAAAIKQITIMDTAKAATLAITKVKTPWYAWKGIIISKMRKTIPEYAVIKGLNEKWYSLAEDKSFFGGIYLWETEADAKRWFTKEWFDATLKKYGEKGRVFYYKVTENKTVAVPEKAEGAFCSVLIYASAENYSWDARAEGLIKVFYLKDDQDQDCFLTIWQNKAAAAAYIASRQMTVEFFETPIFLHNK
ncbi:MAG TPA: hypothetical protein VFR70_03795 [Flavobacterium sp.]|nr:hypothetical protein [Flavobacterium sp.]